MSYNQSYWKGYNKAVKDCYKIANDILTCKNKELTITMVFLFFIAKEIGGLLK